jgi:aldose 1-epimerase
MQECRKERMAKMKILKEDFGFTDQKNVYSFTLINDQGVKISCINYGCIITKMITPDREGNCENIVLGYNTLDEYLSDSYFLGAAVGRIAGRIKAGSFELDGKTYQLAKNENGNHLHGGWYGMQK